MIVVLQAVEVIPNRATWLLPGSLESWTVRRRWRGAPG